MTCYYCYSWFYWK